MLMLVVFKWISIYEFAVEHMTPSKSRQWEKEQILVVKLS